MLRLFFTVKYLGTKQICYLIFRNIIRYLSIQFIKKKKYNFILDRNKNFFFILNYLNIFDKEINKIIIKRLKKKIYLEIK